MRFVFPYRVQVGILLKASVNGTLILSDSFFSLDLPVVWGQYPEFSPSKSFLLARNFGNYNPYVSDQSEPFNYSILGLRIWNHRLQYLVPEGEECPMKQVSP